MNDSQLTPSQAAHRYADKHGFKIVAVGRRYQATHSTGLSFERGGYVALLNEMRKWVDHKASDIAAFDNPNDAKMMHCDVVRDDGAMGVFADTIVGTLNTVIAQQTQNLSDTTGPSVETLEGVTWGELEPITPDTVPMSREELLAPIKEELNRLHSGKEKPVEMCAGGTLVLPEPSADPTLNATANNFFGTLEHEWAHKPADEIKADIVAGVAMLTQQSRDYNDLMPKPGDILRALGETDKQFRRRLKVQVGIIRQTHFVECSWGKTVYSTPYASYAEALKAVRKMMCNKRARPSYINIVPVKVK